VSDLHDALIRAINTPPDPDAKPLTVETLRDAWQRLRVAEYAAYLKYEAEERDN
jgi:hypothetical protein